MAALKEKESASPGNYSGGAAIQKGSSGGATQKIPSHLSRLNKEDRDIAMRLEKLKEDRKGNLDAKFLLSMLHFHL